MDCRVITVKYNGVVRKTHNKVIIDHKWDIIKNNTKIPMRLFKSIVRYTFESLLFVFNGTTYLQLYESAMGNPASPVLALAHLVIEWMFNIKY